MSVAIVTGSAGLVGAEAAVLFAEHGLDVVGIDNDMRSRFFGAPATTDPIRRELERTCPGYKHFPYDIRDIPELTRVFSHYGRSVSVVIHAAAQPSHDWAASAPHIDFEINANGTLNLLELTRQHCPRAVFIHVSTSKVYGDRPNQLPLVELASRWELEAPHPFAQCGIDESMSIDASLHSLLGVSKASGDLLAQEYGRYFGLQTAIFRPGCITGPRHRGAELHGFLAYLVRCAVEGKRYTVIGHKGKQVRDNIHARDLARAFFEVTKSPRVAEVYNMGGGRTSACSVLEALEILEHLGHRAEWNYSDKARTGDHIWWISDHGKFQGHYPEWEPMHSAEAILTEMVESSLLAPLQPDR